MNLQFGYEAPASYRLFEKWIRGDKAHRTACWFPYVDEERLEEGWIWDRKEEAMRDHFKKVEWSDAVLVLNYDKNNIKGYIGANTLLEMGLALHLGKKMYLLNEIPEMGYREELIGMKPTIIDGDLNKVR